MDAQKSSTTRKMLFVCYGAGHVNTLIPLILAAQSDVRFEVTVLGLTTACIALSARGIPYFGFKDFLSSNDTEAVKFGERLVTEMPKKEGLVSREETIAYLGLSYEDLATRHGEFKARQMFSEKGRQAFLPLSVLQKVFDRFSPDILISTNSPRAERAAFMVARERKVPSVCIVDLFAKYAVQWIGEPDFGSRVCVFAESVRQFILSAGRKEDEVLVTGNPAFDRLGRDGLVEEAVELRKQRGWLNKQVILWASQPEPEKHPFTWEAANSALPREIDAELLKVAKKHEDWQVVIRYHPGENMQPFDWPDGAYVSSVDEDLAVLLAASDVVVTMTSTVGLEGLLVGKPLITINKSIFQQDSLFSEMGLGRGVDELELLEEAIVETLSGNGQPQVDLPKAGQATERVFAVIEEVLSDQ